MTPEFVHLHVHSEFSLLDGLGRVNDLVKQAASLGQRALALTDHGTMHGVVDFFRACKKEGIKPIVGVEAYLTKHGRPMQGRDAVLDKDRHHLLLLATDDAGYRNLLAICSHAQLEGYYYRPRVDKPFLEKHAQGLICTSGCLAAEIPKLLNHGQTREAVERVHWYRDVFGPGRFYLELQEHSIPELDRVNRQLIEFSREYDLPLVATNDVHYVRAADASPHDVLLCIQTTTAMTAKDRMRMSDGSYYVRSAAEMDAIFGAYPGALSNSLRIAEMCNVDVEDKQYHLPPFPTPEGRDYQSYLRQLAEEGLRQRYGVRADDPTVRQRFEHELKVIHEMGFDVYFLIVSDLCRYARQRGIWYNVRGSGAGSVIAYVTGITNLDPLPNNLIFERFLNPGRVTMPDFDLDFPDDQREEMIRYTIERYGEDRVAQIVTFGRMKARAAVRDVGRVLEIPLTEVDRVAKMIPNIPGKPVSIKDALAQIPDLKQSYEASPQVKQLLDTASLIEGVARHASIHAAAVIVADKPLIHYAPLMRPQKSAITSMVTQYEFPVLESIGLLKVDFLGLSTLSVMREATRLIAERHGVHYALDTIPLDDPASYQLLASGEVAGVFQVEGAGMRRMLVEMQPHEFNNIVAAISLYRPGPMDYIPEYIACLHGRKQPHYVHPALEPILGETYGVCIYQEQIIQLLTLVAGYTAGESDLVRRAISKKKADVIEKERTKFAQGAARTSGLTRAESDQIWDALEGFARYGFNRAHAADYAVICVQTAYLKAHYPLEFMAAQLLVERDKSDKVTNFIIECRRMGIEVLPPSLNHSGLDFTIQQRPADLAAPGPDAHLAFRFPTPPGAAIRFGLAAIKNVGEGPVETILAARQQDNSPFRSLGDFCQRVDLRKVTRRPLECLIKAGALDEFGERAQLLAGVEAMMAESTAAHEAKDVGQMSLFDLLGAKTAGAAGGVTSIRLPKADPAPVRERLNWEKELLGVYASSHPVLQLGVDISNLVTCQCGSVDVSLAGQPVLLVGMLTEVKQIVTKKGEPMAFCTMEDLSGSVELTVFPRVYAEARPFLTAEKVILVRGKVDSRDASRVSVLVDAVQDHVDLAHIEQEGAFVRGAVRSVGQNGNGKVYSAQFGPSGAEWAAPASVTRTGGAGPISGAWYHFGGDDDDDDAQFSAALDDDEDESEENWNGGAQAPAPMLVHAAAPAAVMPTPAAVMPTPAVAAEPLFLGVHEAPIMPYAAPPPRPRTLYITLAHTVTTEDATQHLGRIYNIMQQRRRPDSQDHVVVLVPQTARRLQLDFPNDPVTCDQGLQADLARLVGWENLRVE